MSEQKSEPLTVGELTANERNPRRISDAQLEGLKRSLLEFGPLDGFVFNRRSRRLVGAHQRKKSIPQNCPVVILEKFSEPNMQGTTARGFVDMQNGERITFREVDWSESKEKAAMIAANKHSGDWEIETLSQLFNELEQSDRDLTGFQEIEIARLIQAIPTEEGETDPHLEWEGMPECENENLLRPFASVLVKFRTQADKKGFEDLIGQRLSEKSKAFIWHPAEKRDLVSDLRYVAE
jgi:hypothetical protein